MGEIYEGRHWKVIYNPNGTNQQTKYVVEIVEDTSDDNYIRWKLQVVGRTKSADMIGEEEGGDIYYYERKRDDERGNIEVKLLEKTKKSRKRRNIRDVVS